MIAIFQSLRHAAFASALLLGAAQTQAALFVDFGEIGAPAIELEPGYQAFSVTNATNYKGTFFDYAGTGLDNGSPVRVTLDNTGTAATA